ncbi:MAG: hypothetical protein H0X27_05320 [Caulobacteraceae bacterium]|nr:hypothetical protein [Caulobacteraceae bacterium]
MLVGMIAAALAVFLAVAAPAAARGALSPTEQAYADWLDATYAVSTLSAGAVAKIDGRDRTAWGASLTERAAVLKAGLDRAARRKLHGEAARALRRMQKAFADPPAAPVTTTTEEAGARCETAPDAGLDRAALSAALYGCFERFGNHIAFEGRTIARAPALELLGELDTAERRKALFDALTPLWRRIDADGAPGSPYRRLIRLAADEAHAKGSSPITDAARTVGASPGQVETWLVAALETWRDANPGPALEPWDYRSHYASAVRPLDRLIPPERITALSFRYYRDLGLDLEAAHAIHDLGVRPGKAPLAYADFIRIGRETPAGWRPALARVSGNVEKGGLSALNEIVHEDGHVAHMLAVRARSAFFELGDDLFVEAFADVTSWAVADPRWQRRYLGASVDEATAKRALFANVMLDVAWGLFEQRMLRDPKADPNAVWTEITSRYLNIRPHPEVSWWALRVQLVDAPGYMINYGLGAVVTADLRRRLREEAGDFDAGNPRWYRYASDHLLRFGGSVETPKLLRRFLGRPVSDAALLAEIAGIGR